MDIDELDVKLLSALSDSGRVRWSTLADQFGISPPAIADRVRRLEQVGAIRGYTVLLDAQRLGFGLTAFISVTLAHPHDRQPFLNYVQANPQIQSCHHVTGEGDYLLKICCAGTAALEQLLSEELKSLPGVVQTRTSIALSALKDEVTLPLSDLLKDFLEEE